MRHFNDTIDISNHPYLLMGDLSGIQEFIFNVKSEGAAKTLKARSYYVQALAEIAIHALEKNLGNQNCILFYNGGGNFYIYSMVDPLAAIQTFKKTAQKSLAVTDIYLCLTYIEWKAAGLDFSGAWKLIHQKSGVEKLKKFFDLSMADIDDTSKLTSFEPYDRASNLDWEKFCDHFRSVPIKRGASGATGFKVLSSGLPESTKTDSFIHEFENFFVLEFNGQEEHDKSFAGSIVNKLPYWTEELIKKHPQIIASLIEERRRRNLLVNDPKDKQKLSIEPGDLIEFSAMGLLAQHRTGTDKIAVLKMDVDKLGDTMQKMKNEHEAGALSNKLKTFFDTKMHTLWQSNFTYVDKTGQSNTDTYEDNIYVVFSGGDDCMIVGAWDAVFQFVSTIKTAYDAEKFPTLSAAISVFDSKFPVVRMAALAEEALKEAKRAGGDRISIFSEVMKWTDFKFCQDTCSDLEKMIKNGSESRAILSRFNNSYDEFKAIEKRVEREGIIAYPPIWKLFYGIRKSKNLVGLEKIMNAYQRSLLHTVITTDPLNPYAVSAAARWAEFLTRNK